MHHQVKYCIFKMPGKRLSSDVVQLVYYNHQIGKSVRELSEMFSVTRKTIYNVLNRAEIEGRLEPKVGGGPKSKITGRAERLMIRKLSQTPQISTRTLARELKEECGISVSHETLRQAILRNKYSSRAAKNIEYIIPITKSEPIESEFNVNMNECHGKNREDNQIIQSEPNKYNAFSEKHSKMWITQEHTSMLEEWQQKELAEIKKEKTDETCTTHEHTSMFDEEYQQKKLAEIKKEEITLTEYSFSYTTLPIKKEYNVAQDISASTNEFLLGHPSTSQNEYSFSYATLPIKKEHNAAESHSGLTNNFLLEHPPSTSQNDYFLKSKISSMDYPSTSSQTLSIMKEHNEAESHLLNSINHFMLDRSSASREHSSALLKPKNVFKFRSAIRKSGKSYCCKLCLKSKKFFQLAALRQHIKFHHFALRFQCFICNFNTASPRFLRNHYKKLHNTNGPIKLAFTYLRSPMPIRAGKAKNKSQPHTKITKTNTEDFKKNK